MHASDLEQIVSLCKRRGFVYQSAEIYGGFRSTYDYGPLGSLLLRNVKDAWVRSIVQQRDDVVLIDAAILSPPQVWQASGHLANFTDPLVDCTECKQRFRLDKLDDPDVCPNCGAKHSFTEAREFNLMFKTQAGPVEGTGADAYLRPETAQGMFVGGGGQRHKGEVEGSKEECAHLARGKKHFVRYLASSIFLMAISDPKKRLHVFLQETTALYNPCNRSHDTPGASTCS